MVLKLVLKIYENLGLYNFWVKVQTFSFSEQVLDICLLTMETHANRLPFVVSVEPNHGRCLIATRAIREGEEIFNEKSIIAGPHGEIACFEAKALSTCLGCYKNIQGLYRCSKCGWPVCGIQCEDVSLIFKLVPIRNHAFNFLWKVYMYRIVCENNSLTRNHRTRHVCMLIHKFSHEALFLSNLFL